jgi:hypothetical protein
VEPSRIWLRSPRFDVGLQLVPLAVVAPAALLYAGLDAGRAAAVLPLAMLFALPFLHVAGSFVFAFSPERNRSASPPRRLAALWALWAIAVLALLPIAPRALATGALLYGGWHIFRQNFGFLRELAGRAGAGGDRALRRLDHAACAAPAVALWLQIAAHGPWSFIGVEVGRLAVPDAVLGLAFAAVPATALLRQARRGAPAGGLLILGGNALALLGPALLLDDLTLIYTLSATFHGVQYLAYLVERERERDRTLLPLASGIVLSMMAWLAAVMALSLLPLALAERALAGLWYLIVPFHYFVDGRIWRRPRLAVAA